jgi:hypothetical protein
MKKIFIALSIIFLLIIITFGVFYFSNSSSLLCSIIRGDYRCTYGWGKHCACTLRYIDGGKPCTSSSQCTSKMCTLTAAQLKQLGYDVYPNSNETNAAGNHRNCFLKEIDQLPNDIGQTGECQTFPLDIFSWGCVGVLNDGNVKFKCGCAVQ